MTNKELTIREAKKQDIVFLFFKLLKENPNKKIQDIFKEMESCSAPRFYITVFDARRYVSRIARGKPLSLKNARKREMCFDIYRLWQEDCNKKGIEPLRSGGSFGFFANTRNITEDFLAKPAPSFYLDTETMRGIVYKELRKKKK